MSRRRKEEEAQPENHERWIVSYADMLTLLFALFVVLYTMGDPNPQKLEQVRTSLDRAFQIGVLTSSDGASPIFEGGGGLTPSINEIRENDIADIAETLKPFSGLGSDGVQVRSDGQSITVSLADNMLFASGSAALEPDSREVLDEVATLLGAMPNNVRVEGHTDNVPVNHPDYPTNWELSSARANTVVRFLVDEGGIEADRLSAAAFADTQPLASNDTPEGRALNRRADIVILTPPRKTSATSPPL
ncbi:MAG: OmpA family protein [Dehalococcoidia bacterium]|nr:OmpA family protein [Dehalococcoidia bacterium]